MFQLSHLKLFTGVFFALFILSACGGGGGDAAAPATAAVQTCEQQGLYNNGTECVAATDPSTCIANQLVVANICTDYTAETCTEFFNSSGECVAVNNGSTCTVNELVVDNLCTTYTDTTCLADSKYWDSDSSTCVAATDPGTCTVNELVVDNLCTTYTSDTCLADGKFFDSTDTCVARVADASCANHTVSPYETVDLGTNECYDPYTPKTLADFQTDEYSKSGALAGVSAAQAYVNIENLVDADHNAGNVTQGGEKQIVSVVSDSYNGFNTKHQEFTENGTQGAAFDSIYLASTQANHTGTNNIINAGNCVANSYTPCASTPYAALIAGRKGETATEQMHGIAYNAQLRGIYSTTNSLHERRAVAAGVGAHIIAMNYTITHTDLNYTSVGNIRVCYDDGGTDRKYGRSAGLNQGQDDCALTNDRTDTRHNDDVLAAWVAAANPDSANKTIMVLPTGNDGLNSESGQVKTIYDADTGYANSGVSNRNALTITGSVAAANIPSFRSAYPVFYVDDALQTGRWLAVTAVDNTGAILDIANGCGVAMSFCLAAPGKDLHAAKEGDTQYASYSGTDYASSTVAGGLAVLKGAFPNATPEQLTRLVLDTSDYIALDDALYGSQEALTQTEIDAGVTDEDIKYRKQVCKDTNGNVAISDDDDACTGDASGFTHAAHPNGTDMLYVNPVYGYGEMNLATATTASLVSSYVTASNNESIGALWQDTKLTLSSHFGSKFESVKFSIGDEYGRHFITDAPQTSYAPIAVSLDDYMGNLLGENVQSQRLGGQAQLNYSNSGETWMNLEYISGKATTKIAFQDSYKVSPLTDVGTSSILRANNIRPASKNIGMMDVDYKLGRNLSLSSYAASGEYDTGYKFDELGSDFEVNYKDSHLNIAIGNIREHGQFLGTNTSGAYALNAPTVSRFTDVTYGHDIGAKFNIYANYINYETDVDMLHDQFATIDNLQADQYQIGFTGKGLISKDDSLNVALITKLGVTDGALNQNTVQGYTADGGFNNVNQSYDLAVNQRHQQFEITYQGKLYQNADKISALRDNRFFTSIIVDSNLNHVQGASQVEVVSGINIRY